MKSAGFGKSQGTHTNHGFKGGGGFSKMKNNDCDYGDEKKSDKKKKKK